MKMGETMMVLVVFFMLVMVGLIIYSGYRKDSLERKAAESDALKSIEIATMLTELPEMQCSEFMCINCDNAIDLLKLQALSDGCPDCDEDYAYSVIRSNRVVYAGMFSTTTVKVNVIDSVSEDDAAIVTYNVYNASGLKETALNPYFIPVNVYDALTDECKMGVVEIVTWS